MSGFTGWVGSLQQRLDNWARQQRDLVTHIASPLPQVLPLPRWQWGWKWQWQWPWQSARVRKEQLEEEYKRRKEQIESLCGALKAEDVRDLKDILSAMILSECVYKRPESEVIRCVNKFSADFGGQLVQLERLQASLDHVSHRYLLAESSDTLFASFIGTKHYKDMITDANILQGPLFHEEDIGADDQQADIDIEATSNPRGTPTTGPVVLKLGTQSTNGKGKKSHFKPAAHRGFLARAKGIPAVELYRLAKKKDRRLVLCGHSLGGAVAVLATLAILKVLGQLSTSSSSSSKKKKQVEVKCITFSQPPVGNAALTDYVHEKGWHGHFRTYCIPEDLVPRILSPAYFQQYRSQAKPRGVIDSMANTLSDAKDNHLGLTDSINLERGLAAAAATEGKPDALGSSPLQSSLKRLSALVPQIGGPKPFHPLKSKVNLSTKSTATLKSEDSSLEPLALKEVAGAASMASVSQSVDIDRSASVELAKSGAADWRNRVPSLPSYVPFGQLFLLEKSSVEPLSASEYTLLTSMQSVLLELRDRFRSHTMRSYRARFQRIYDLCMCDSVPPNFSMERVPYLPHLQQWLGLPGVTVTEPGKIAEPLTLVSATSLVPIGWTGVPGDKRGSPFKVDLCGYGLHLCTLVKAQINGQWCSATVEFLPSPVNGELQKTQKEIQRMRVRIGQPIQEPSWPRLVSAANAAENTSENCRPGRENACTADDISSSFGARNSDVGGLTEVVIHCSSDFMTATKKVVLRLRRVRLLGLEGAGKTSLYYALLGQGRGTMFSTSDGMFPDVDRREGVAEGVAFIDPAGVNLQDLAGEIDQLKQELNPSSMHEGSKKVDLVILVHNLAHKIPRLHQSVKPALSVLMDEVNSAKIPSILAITNKFAISADRRQPAAATVMQAYQMPSNLSVVVNSSTYAVHESEGATSAVVQEKSADVAGRRLANLNGIMQGATQKIISAPVSLIQLPFRRKQVVLPVEGVKNLLELVNRVLLDHEDAALMELSKEQLLLEMKYLLVKVADQAQKHEKGLSSPAAASAVGASLGLVVALVAAAASGLRKP